SYRGKVFLLGHPMDPVLGAQLEVAAAVPLVQLLALVAGHLLDDPAALHGRAGHDRLPPAHDMLILVAGENFLGAGRIAAAREVPRSSPNFSARYRRIAPLSNTRTGSAPLRSTRAGIFELGLMSTKPLENWSPSPMRSGQASYSASACPLACSSSNRMPTFCPLGVASE